MHKHVRDCRLLCVECGLTPVAIKHRGKHFAVECIEASVIFPSTPSDRRWRANARCFIRRIARHSI